MKVFLMSFTLFLSAYLWATTCTLTHDSANSVTTIPSNLDAKADCVKDIELYCDYNTSFSINQCWEKAADACDGKANAMREISEGAKTKSLNEVQKLSLD